MDMVNKLKQFNNWSRKINHFLTWFNNWSLKINYILIWFNNWSRKINHFLTWFNNWSLKINHVLTWFNNWSRKINHFLTWFNNWSRKINHLLTLASLFPKNPGATSWNVVRPLGRSLLIETQLRGKLNINHIATVFVNFPQTLYEIQIRRSVLHTKIFATMPNPSKDNILQAGTEVPVHMLLSSLGPTIPC
jgi:hypothetical protein